MQFQMVLILFLALSTCALGETSEQFFVSIDLEASHIPGNPLSKLAELIRTHPDKRFVHDFPMFLAQHRFMVLFLEGKPERRSYGLHNVMSVQTRDLKDPRTDKTGRYLILKIMTSYLVNPNIDARIKQSALRHEWEHLLERFEYGPPMWRSYAENTTRADVMTRELVLQKFKGELRAYKAEMMLHKAAGWELMTDPYKSYRNGGELALRDWLGRVIKEDPEYKPFEEFIHSLVADNTLVPFGK